MISRQLDEEVIFHTARQIDKPKLRADYLEQVCGDNTALLTRVRALLEVHEQEQDFLRSAGPEATATLDAEPITEAPGTEIGRYRLMEQIGEGGMGVVFVAEQRQPLRRKVALKVIKPGMDSKAVVARFEAERQTLALMDHPNIAHVLDAGSTRTGRPYFVMDLVRGIPITEYCDQNKLTIRERLELFVNVCQAIQHAHQKGIIHRDIKPTNVLVTEQDGRAIPKVIDFGVAKALNQTLTERTIYTSFQAIVGTPLYMSPEQARLSAVDVDTRSDVYSLGVLLYELLTGVTPLGKQRLAEAAQEEVLRIIREEEPPKPSTRINTLGDTATAISQHRKTDPAGLRRAVRGDLDWIVMKAMEKDRLRRYDTASAFAADIERLLGNEPIEARPPSSIYRLRKFAGKNRGVVASVCAVGIALLFGMCQARISQRAAESLNRELEATLATLTTEYLDRAVGDALAGDVRACEESLELARRVHADDSLLRVIHALALMYGGRLTEAISELKKAKASDPDNLAVLAASLWANLNKGEVQLVTDISEAITRLEAAGRRPSNDYERLLLAHTKVFGSGLSETLADLDEVISRHPRWGIAYAIRAEARSELARQTKDMGELRKAVSDAVLAGRYHPDNAFVLSSTMDVYVTSIELARHEGKLSASDIQVLENRTTEIASQLESRPDYLFGRSWRLVFYRLMRRDAEHAREYAALRGQGFGGDQSIVADLLLNNAPSKLQAYYRENPHSFAAQTAIALLDVLNGDRGAASSALHRLKHEFVHPNQRWLMLDLALVARNRELARQLANEFLRPDTAGSDDWFNRLDGVMTEYYAGEISENKLLEVCGPFLVERSIAHYAIGMWKLSGAESETDWETVKQHLKIAADCPIPGWWHVEFANAYLQLIEDRRILLRNTAGDEISGMISPPVVRPQEEM